MQIIKMPKKLRDAFAIIRSGQLEVGLAQLDSTSGFEAQKSVARAELNYFQGNYAEAMYHDEQALPHDTDWYASNVLTEHFWAYTTAARLSGQTARAADFYRSFLAAKQQLGLAEHQHSFYRYQVEQHLRKLVGETKLPMSPAPLPIVRIGKPLAAFVDQLKKYRPKLTIDSAEGAQYLLHFLFSQVPAAECLAYYEQYRADLPLEDHHLSAARLYAQLGQLEKSRAALLTLATNAWYPVEHMQVAPMRLWEFEELHPVLSPQFKLAVLAAAKAQS